MSFIRDTTTDGHTSSHITLQIITSQGSKPFHIKVDPGESVSTIPLSHQLFPKNFTKTGT